MKKIAYFISVIFIGVILNLFVHPVLGSIVAVVGGALPYYRDNF
jgi:hypothetical protein